MIIYVYIHNVAKKLYFLAMIKNIVRHLNTPIVSRSFLNSLLEAESSTYESDGT